MLDEVTALITSTGPLVTVAAGLGVVLLLMPVVLALSFELPGFVRWWRDSRWSRRQASMPVRLLTPLESVNELVGRLVAWLALTMVLTQALIVVLRYVFSVGSIGLQESVWYMHGLLFMLGAGYTLARDEHVRLDIVYSKLTDRGRAWVNLLGTALALIPFCLALMWLSFGYVEKSWAINEGSAEVGGLPWLWVLKTTLVVFSVLLLIQGLVTLWRSALTIANIYIGEEIRTQ